MMTDTDLLSVVATEVCHELFLTARRDQKIMCSNWCAFAVLAMYREVSLLIGGGISIPSIDDCMTGRHDPSVLYSSPEWKQLLLWHEEHWQRSQRPSEWDSYEPYFSIQSLNVGSHILTM